MDIPCYIWPLITGLICALLGCLICKLTSKEKDNSSEIDFWRNKNEALEKDLAACKAKLQDCEGKLEAKASVATNLNIGGNGSSGNIASTVSSLAAGAAIGATTRAAVPAGVPFDAAAAKAAFGKKVKENDLTVVEGIGPKISELFNDNGINTWAALATTAVETLQGYLDSKGERYRVHNPGTWPMQAGLASEGKWAELKKWQDEHDYGKA